MRSLRCFETSGSDNRATQSRIPEEGNPQPNCYENLKWQESNGCTSCVERDFLPSVVVASFLKKKKNCETVYTAMLNGLVTLWYHFGNTLVTLNSKTYALCAIFRMICGPPLICTSHLASNIAALYTSQVR